MKFEDAMQALKEGKSIRRPEWKHECCVSQKSPIIKDILQEDWEVIEIPQDEASCQGEHHLRDFCLWCIG